MICIGKRFIDVAAIFRHRVADVAVDLFARKRRAWFERLFRVRNARQCFIFDFNSLGRVLGLRSRGRHHRRDGNTGAVHGAAGEHRVWRNLHVRQHLGRREI